MSGISQTEGNPAGTGGANANSTPSEPQSQPSLEDQLAALNTNLNKALTKLDAQDGEIRALKSGKDKAVDRAVGELQPLKETVAKIAKYLNISETEVLKAQRELVLEDLVNERLGSGVQPQSTGQGSSERRGNAVELQIVDELLELPTNDSRVTQLKLDYGNDTNAYKEQAKKLKVQLATGEPTPAEQPLPAGGSITRTKTVSQLEADYQKEAAAILQSKKGDERLRAISALKAKYRGLGLDKI